MWIPNDTDIYTNTMNWAYIISYQVFEYKKSMHCPYMKDRFWSLIFLDFLRPHTTFEAPSRCKWLKDVEGACGRENLSRWILVLWAEAHYTLCTPMDWPVDVITHMCTAIAWHLFLRQPKTSDVICLCLCLAGKQGTWPSHYVYLNTRVNC